MFNTANSIISMQVSKLDEIYQFKSTITKNDLYQFNKVANPKMNMIMSRLKNP